MATIDEVLATRADDLLYQGFNLAMFVPKYVVKKISSIKQSNTFTVYLARKNPKINLHVLAFYIACRTKLIQLGIDPDASFQRVRTKKNYHYYKKGKLKKENCKKYSILTRYLKNGEMIDNYRSSGAKYDYVIVSFTDNNSKSYIGFSIKAFSINVTMFVSIEAREMVKEKCGGDYALLLEKLLLWLGYPKAVYIAAGYKRSLHRLMVLQRDIEKMVVEGDAQ